MAGKQYRLTAVLSLRNKLSGQLSKVKSATSKVAKTVSKDMSAISRAVSTGAKRVKTVSGRLFQPISGAATQATIAVKGLVSAVKKVRGISAPTTRPATAAPPQSNAVYSGGRWRNPNTGRFVAGANAATNAAIRATTATGKTSTSLNKLTQSNARAGSSFMSMTKGIVGMTAAFGVLTAAASPFLKVVQGIKDAFKFEMNQATITAMFKGDTKQADAYMNMLSKRALDSPLFQEQDYFQYSKSFVGMSKDINQLSAMWGIAERLAAADPVQGLEGAVFAMREMFSGDAVSMVERFEMPRAKMNEIKKLDINGQINALDKQLSEMGFGADFLDKISDTGTAYKNQIQEKFQKAFKNIGTGALEEMKPRMKAFNESLDTGGLEQFTKIGTKVMKTFFSYTFRGFDMFVNKVAKPFVKWFKEMSAWTYPLAKGIGVAIAAFAAFSAVTMVIRAVGAAISFLTSPIGLVLVAIALLYAAWDGNWWGFRDTVIKVWNYIFPYLTKAWNWIVNLFKTSGPKIQSTVMSMMSKVKQIFLTYWPMVVNIAKQVWGVLVNIYRTFAPIIVQVVQYAWGLIQRIIAFVMPFIVGLIQKYVPMIVKAFQTVYNYIMMIMPKVLEVITRIWNTIWPIVKFAVDVIWEVVKVAFTAIWGIIEWVMNLIVNVIRVAWDVVSGVFNFWVSLLSGDVVGAFTGLWDTVQKVFGKNGITKIFTDAIGGAWDVGKNLAGAIRDGFTNVFTSFIDNVKGLWDGLTGWFKKGDKKISPQLEIPSEAERAAFIPGGYSAARGSFGPAPKTPASIPYKSHSGGLDYVPYDGYKANLHKGERVLTKEENKEQSSAQRPIIVNIPKLADTINASDPKDVDKMMGIFARKLNELGGAPA